MCSPKFLFIFIIINFISIANTVWGIESDVKKTHLEDIFIWKMSDELKLSAQDEKKFTEIQKELNRKKSDLNREIQETSLAMVPLAEGPPAKLSQALKKYRRLLFDYNQLTLKEYDSIKSLLGNKKFAEYLQIKSELNIKVKSILVGEKDKKESSTGPLPPPKIIIEKNNPTDP